MLDIDKKLKDAEAEGNDITIGKPASEQSIKKLEELIGTQLPTSYKGFLSKYGCIGVHESFIEGIFDDNPEDESAGIYGATLEMRKWISESYDEIEPHLWAIKIHEDGAYCVNTEIKLPNNELAIVNYEPHLPKETYKEVLANSFEEYLEKWFF